MEYMIVSELIPADHNPKDHAEEDIHASISRFGFADPALLDERTGKLIEGHGRVDDLLKREQAGEDPPEGIVKNAAGKYLMPVMRGWSSEDDAEAEAFLITLNHLTAKGGWHGEELYVMLDRLSDIDDGLLGTGYESADLDDLLAGLQEREIGFDPTEGYSGKEGAHAEASLDERAQQYARKGIRSLVLDFKLDEFDVIAANLARFRRAKNHETNAEAVFALVTEAAAELPPE